MKNWVYGIGSLDKTAHISLQEAPFYMFALDWIVHFIDSLVLPIPLPKIRIRLKDPGDIEVNGSEITTWRDWYGDLSQLWWVYVYDPYFQWYYRKMDEKTIMVSYDELRELFYEEDKKFWDEQEED